MTKICVTGNRGFIGKQLQNELDKNGCVVLGIEKWIFDRVRWQDRLHEYLVNLNPDAVFHVGACSDTQNQDVNEMLKLNTEATFIIADWCQFKGIPLIYSSSASIYGTKGTPETLYSWSKYLAEQYVRKCGGISLRYYNVYGVGEYEKGNMSSLACQAFFNHRNGNKTYLFPNKPMRDFVYIKDVISANIHAWENYELHKGGTFDVGTGEARLFEDMLNLMEIPFEYTSEDAIPNNYQTFTQADERYFLKGWKPSWNLEKGVENYKHLLEISHPLIF